MKSYVSVCQANACEQLEIGHRMLDLISKFPIHGNLWQGFIISYKLKRNNCPSKTGCFFKSVMQGVELCSGNVVHLSSCVLEVCLIMCISRGGCWQRGLGVKSDGLGFQPGSATVWLCHLGQVV